MYFTLLHGNKLNGYKLFLVFQFLPRKFSFNWTIDNINEFRLQQDHPCVISLIRRLFLKSPSPLDVPYRLDHPEIVDQSAIQTGVILKHLENQVRI